MPQCFIQVEIKCNRIFSLVTHKIVGMTWCNIIDTIQYGVISYEVGNVSVQENLISFY